jgi:hypothetical protein
MKNPFAMFDFHPSLLNALDAAQPQVKLSSLRSISLNLDHSLDMANKDEIFGLENNVKVLNTVVYNDSCLLYYFSARLLTLVFQKKIDIVPCIGTLYDPSFLQLRW